MAGNDKNKPPTDLLARALAAAGQFKPLESIDAVQDYGNGNVNDTFLVTLKSKGESKFILQRINLYVFRHPELIMKNLCTISEHIRERLRLKHEEKSDRNHPWEMVSALMTRGGEDHWIDPERSFWRAISFIGGGHALDSIHNSGEAAEVGYALGQFHQLLSDLPSEKLADSLVGFHITPGYLSHYKTICEKADFKSAHEVRFCTDFIRKRSSWAHVLEKARKNGELNLRSIHGDPKVNNVILNKYTGRAIGIVDFDTVKPGLVQYDIGDCMRSGCNPRGEEGKDWETVYFEPELCRAILRGYFSMAVSFLTPDDYKYIFDSIRLLAFECGLRFFTDYLEGNVYFKVTHREHNLARSLVQFKLVESIEKQERLIRAIIRDEMHLTTR